MKTVPSLIRLLGFLIILTGCHKSESRPLNDRAPSDLVITALVAADGSGIVDFRATAVNATSYEYDFGDGESKIVTGGATTHRYSAAGGNRFTVAVIAKSNSGLALRKTKEITVSFDAAGTSLAWSDEFNTDGRPDSSKWSYETGAGGWGNHELEYYTGRSENSFVEGGTLKIRALKESYQGSPFTSARLVSRGKFDFTYGRVEARAKLPAGAGTWPAIWMLGSNAATVGWPDCGEIDIMEHVGRQLNTIYGTLHYPGHFGGNADGSTKVIADATTKFHLYALDWSPNAIKIYVDSQLVHTVVNSDKLPFNHDFFFILNVAMGGDFGGDVDPGIAAATMEIDYIRVYK